MFFFTRQTFMIRRFFSSWREYPAQFWLMFIGLLISAIGSSMIWPFLMIYVSEKLQLPLSNVTVLMTLNAVAGLISSAIAGPVIDKTGRKWVMVGSLFANGVIQVFMSHASTFAMFALLMSTTGFFNPLYRVGADAMMADLIPQEKRADGYSLMRLSNNVGVAVGPAIGGFIASSSYSLAFYLSAAGLVIYSLLIGFFAHETLPAKTQTDDASASPREKWGGYGKIFGDGNFIAFVSAFTLAMVSASIMWVLLSVYTKNNFGISEKQFGLIPTTNALMVIFLQMWVTSRLKKRKALPVMALGSLFYAVGVGSIAFYSGFWGFWLGMVVMSAGELILVPTATTFAANKAPADMRGRYMSIYGLTQGTAQGIGPILGGLLNDHLGPRFIWLGAFVVGMIAMAGFWVMNTHTSKRTATAA
jgi:MFS family permease